MGSDLWALPALGTGHRLGMRCTKSACALRPCGVRGAADPHSTQIEDHVTLNRLHLEHLECSHQPHTQGRGSKKRPRAGCWAEKLTRLFTSRNPAEPGRSRRALFARWGARGALLRLHRHRRRRHRRPRSPPPQEGPQLPPLVCGWAAARRPVVCESWSAGYRWKANPPIYVLPSWLYHSPHTSGELLLLSFSSPC